MSVEVIFEINRPRTRRVLELIQQAGPMTRAQFEAAHVLGTANWSVKAFQALHEAGYLTIVNQTETRAWVYEAARPVEDLRTIHDPDLSYLKSHSAVVRSTSIRRRYSNGAKDRWRETLQADVERFLSAGGEIEELPGPPDQGIRPTPAAASRGGW